jgi:hypothetical protein
MGRVGVLVLLGMHAGRVCLFGLLGFDGVAFGGAGKGGGWVRPDQVILHFFQVRENSCEALL